MYALVNCEIFTAAEVLHDQAVLVRDGTIADVVPRAAVPADYEEHDLGNLSVAPGFIDLQVNGGGDVLFNDAPSPETVRAIVAAHRRFGTTDLLPTFITGRDDAMADAIDAVRACLRAGDTGVLGIHLEGPFLNPEKAGVHEPGLMRRMTLADVELLPDLGDGAVVMTVAPECVDEGVIAEATRRGVRVSAGHTNATRDEILRAFSEGVDCTTHLFNAMRALESREPGVVGAALEADAISASIIVDGHHVHFGTVRVAWQAKAPRKLFLVTDAMPPVGGTRSSFWIGGREAHVEGGRCQTTGGVLAGSALDMASAVRHCVHDVGIPKDEALRMASTYPAEYLGVADRLGRVRSGYRANLAIFDDEIHVRGVVVNGELTRW